MDRGQISKVIQNLLLNFREAMPDSGLIDFRSRNSCPSGEPGPELLPGRPCVSIAISDRGNWIPESNLDRVFDPYFSTKETGSGLGLAVSHSVVAKRDGQIAVDARPGGGTTFTVRLPASPKELPRAADVASPSQRDRPGHA